MENKYKERKPKYNRDYYNKHRDRLLENMKKSITCECGCTITSTNMPKHLRSKKHAKKMEAIESNSDSNDSTDSDEIN